MFYTTIQMLVKLQLISRQALSIKPRTTRTEARTPFSGFPRKEPEWVCEIDLANLLSLPGAWDTPLCQEAFGLFVFFPAPGKFWGFSNLDSQALAPLAMPSVFPSNSETLS